MSDSNFLIFITCGLVLGYFGYRIINSRIDKQNQRKEAEQLKNEDYQKIVVVREACKLSIYYLTPRRLGISPQTIKII